jgi:chromatin structure-remodeling complex subunit RSC3/30
MFQIKLYHIGLPAAGVLTIELLRRSQHAPHTINSFPTQFPCSDVIQQLTLVVLNLETFIWPDEGDYGMAKQASKVISKALDRIHSSEPFIQSVSTASSDSSTPNRLSGDDISSVDETDLMNWLENTDWGQDSWLDFS